MFLNNKHIPQGTVSYKTYTPGSRLEILKPSVLMGSARHQALLKQLAILVGVDDESYAHFYQATIDRFASFVQVLPTQPSGPLSGILNEGLVRSFLGVKAYLENSSSDDQLMLYAIFSAGLLSGLANAMINQLVVFVNNEGEYLGDWLPFKGPMLDQAEYFKIYELGSTYQRLDSTLTPMLAEVILPKDAFLWLSSEMPVFAEWLDALRGEHITGGRVSHTLSLIPHDDFLQILNSLLMNMPIELLNSPGTEYGDLFFEWLREGLDKGTIEINSADAAVYTVADGVFLELQKVFHKFSEATRLPVNMNVVFQQFGNLFGIASKGGGDYLNRQYFSKNHHAGKGAFAGAFGRKQHTVHNGVVINNAGLVFKNGQPPVATGELRESSRQKNASRQLPSVIAKSSNEFGNKK